MGAADVGDRRPLGNAQGGAGLDLARGQADLAIRFFRPQGEGLVAVKASPIGWGLYASDAYLARRGPVELGQFARHEIIAFDESLKRTAGAVWLSEHAKDATVVLRCNSPRALSDAVAAGMGVSALPCFIAAGNPLLRRLSPSVLASSEVWLVVHEDLRSVPRVRAVMDFIHGIFQRERALFAGDQ